MADILREARQDNKHYARVIGPEGEPRAVLIAMTAPGYWSQRHASHIVFWYSEQPGAGYKLLKAYRSWVLENARTIRVAGLQMTAPMWAAKMILIKAGFNQHGMMYTRSERKPLLEQAKEENGVSQ